MKIRIHDNSGKCSIVKEVGPDHLTTTAQEAAFEDRAKDIRAMGPLELRAEMNAIRGRLYDRRDQLDPEMIPVQHKLLKLAIRQSMKNSGTNPEAPGDRLNYSPGHDMRIGGATAERSQVGPGGVNVDEIEFNGDEETRKAATEIIERNRKWKDDLAKKNRQQTIDRARSMYEMEVRSMNRIYGITGTGTNPRSEAKKIVSRVYGQDIADQVAGV